MDKVKRNHRTTALNHDQVIEAVHRAGQVLEEQSAVGQLEANGVLYPNGFASFQVIKVPDNDLMLKITRPEGLTDLETNLRRVARRHCQPGCSKPHCRQSRLDWQKVSRLTKLTGDILETIQAGKAFLAAGYIWPGNWGGVLVMHRPDTDGDPQEIAAINRPEDIDDWPETVKQTVADALVC